MSLASTALAGGFFTTITTWEALSRSVYGIYSDTSPTTKNLDETAEISNQSCGAKWVGGYPYHGALPLRGSLDLSFLFFTESPMNQLDT